VLNERWTRDDGVPTRIRLPVATADVSFFARAIVFRRGDVRPVRHPVRLVHRLPGPAAAVSVDASPTVGRPDACGTTRRERFQIGSTRWPFSKRNQKLRVSTSHDGSSAAFDWTGENETTRRHRWTSVRSVFGSAKTVNTSTSPFWEEAGVFRIARVRNTSSYT